MSKRIQENNFYSKKDEKYLLDILNSLNEYKNDLKTQYDECKTLIKDLKKYKQNLFKKFKNKVNLCIEVFNTFLNYYEKNDNSALEDIKTVFKKLRDFDYQDDDDVQVFYFLLNKFDKQSKILLKDMKDAYNFIFKDIKI